MNTKKCQKCYWFKPLVTIANKIRQWLGFPLNGYCANSIIQMNVNDDENCPEWNKQQPAVQLPPEPIQPLPDEWLVMSAGQSPLHYLWFIEALDFKRHIARQNDKTLPERMIFVEEYDTFEEGMEAFDKNNLWRLA